MASIEILGGSFPAKKYFFLTTPSSSRTRQANSAKRKYMKRILNPLK